MFQVLATALLAFGLTSTSAGAASVSVVGLFPGKAVLVIDGGAPHTVSVGAKAGEGIRLLSVDNDSAVVDVDGARQRLSIGETAASAGGGHNEAPSEINLIANAQGHFLTAGAINGAPVQFLVDTGASMVAIGKSDALRIGIDLRKAEVAYSQTANGVAQVWRVKLNSVKVGSVILYDVDGAVMSTDMPGVLLGMSFLNRMEMQRDGIRMTLRKRY